MQSLTLITSKLYGGQENRYIKIVDNAGHWNSLPFNTDHYVCSDLFHPSQKSTLKCILLQNKMHAFETFVCLTFCFLSAMILSFWNLLGSYRYWGNEASYTYHHFTKPSRLHFVHVCARPMHKQKPHQMQGFEQTWAIHAYPLTFSKLSNCWQSNNLCCISGLQIFFKQRGKKKDHWFVFALEGWGQNLHAWITTHECT